MSEEWTPESLRRLALGYMPSAALLAAAELDIFGVLARGPASAGELAAALQADLRPTTILVDALASLGLLEKRDGLYHPAPGTVDALTANGRATILPFVQHHANTLRSWARLADVVVTGRPARVDPSVRGAAADRAAYIETMAVSARHASEVIAALGPLAFDHLLDIGCGPGAWGMALLRAVPGARATFFDLPEVLPLTRKHVEAAGFGDRVTYVSGDFRADEALPAGADMVWISAVAHMNSRQQNRELFAKAHAASRPGGCIMVRDFVMEPTHTEPTFGAMFAVHMLVRTELGGTYSFEELVEDLEVAGFEAPELFRHRLDREAIVRARRRGRP